MVLSYFLVKCQCYHIALCTHVYPKTPKFTDDISSMSQVVYHLALLLKFHWEHFIHFFIDYSHSASNHSFTAIVCKMIEFIYDTCSKSWTYIAPMYVYHVCTYNANILANLTYLQLMVQFVSLVNLVCPSDHFRI